MNDMSHPVKDYSKPELIALQQKRGVNSNDGHTAQASKLEVASNRP